MANIIETIDKMAFEVRQKAESLGYDVDLEDLADAKGIDEAYYVGRYEQLLSLQSELEKDGGLKLFKATVENADEILIEELGTANVEVEVEDEEYWDEFAKNAFADSNQKEH